MRDEADRRPQSTSSSISSARWSSSVRPTGGWPLPLVVWLRRLHRAAALFHPAARPGRRGAGRCPLDDDRAAIVDSYTNIATVKLFSHARREESYAREGMDGVPATRSTGRCGWSTLLNIVIYVHQLAAAVLGRRRCRSGCGCNGSVTDRRGRGGRSALVLRLQGHVAVDHVGDVGAVREHRHGAGRHRLDLAAAAGRRPARRAKDSTVPQRRDPLRSRRLPLRQAQAASSTTCRSHPAGREGRAGRPLGRRQVDAGQPAAALLRPRERARS